MRPITLMFVFQDILQAISYSFFNENVMSYFVYSSSLIKLLYFGEKKIMINEYIFHVRYMRKQLGNNSKKICDLTNELQVYRLKKNCQKNFLLNVAKSIKKPKKTNITLIQSLALEKIKLFRKHLLSVFFIINETLIIIIKM